MSKVIMMCGVCGSGKTTYSKQKEKEGYIRLSIDEEMWKSYGIALLRTGPALLDMLEDCPDISKDRTFK